MERCILFVCWTVLTEGDFKSAGTILWHGNGWEVVQIIRNNDTTDPGCRLSRTGDKGGRLEIDAHFIAGRIGIELTKALPIQGDVDLGIYGLFGEGKTWGGTAYSAQFTDKRINADIGGMTAADLLREWSERGVKDLALLYVDKEEWLFKIPVPGLPEATAAFMDCYDALP